MEHTVFNVSKDLYAPKSVQKLEAHVLFLLSISETTVGLSS